MAVKDRLVLNIFCRKSRQDVPINWIWGKKKRIKMEFFMVLLQAGDSAIYRAEEGLN